MSDADSEENGYGCALVRAGSIAPLRDCPDMFIDSWFAPRSDRGGADHADVCDNAFASDDRLEDADTEASRGVWDSRLVRVDACQLVWFEDVTADAHGGGIGSRRADGRR